MVTVVTRFGLMYCCLSMSCQLQADCSVLLLLCKWHLTQPGSEGGWMATGSFQTLRPATVYMFPSTAHKDLGAEAVTQSGQTRQGLVPSLMDDLSAPAWPALPGSRPRAYEYTLCAVSNATHLQGLCKDAAPVCNPGHLQVRAVHNQLHLGPLITVQSSGTYSVLQSRLAFGV